MAKQPNEHQGSKAGAHEQDQDTLFRILEAQEKMNQMLSALELEQKALRGYLEGRLSEEEISKFIRQLMDSIVDQPGGEFAQRMAAMEEQQKRWEENAEELFAKHAQAAIEDHEEETINLAEAERDIVDRITRSKMRG